VNTHPIVKIVRLRLDVANTKKMLDGDYGDLGSLDVSLSWMSGPALYMAAYHGHFDIVKLLVNAGAGVNVVGNQGGSPLLVAALGGHVKTVEFLSSHPDIDVNLMDPNDTTPLTIAAEHRHLEVVRQLLQVDDIDIYQCNKFGEGPIDFARLSQDAEMISLIEAHDGFQQPTSWTSESVNGIYDVYKEADRSALFYFCRYGDNVQVEKLLNIEGIEANKAFYEKCHGYWTTPLATAANHGHIECVKLLLQHPTIDVNDGGKNNVSIVHDSILNGNLAMLSLFLQHPHFNVRSTVGVAQKAPLIVFSLSMQQTECFKQIMEHPNIDINMCDAQGVSALLVAGLTSNTEAIDILLAHPDINVHLTTRTPGANSSIYARRKEENNFASQTEKDQNSIQLLESLTGPPTNMISSWRKDFGCMNGGGGGGAAQSLKLKLKYVGLLGKRVWKTECGGCGHTGTQVLKKCSSCKVVHYCNRECQIQGFKLHKTVCKKLKKQRKKEEDN
jgi:ankyrin repeat protein